MIQTKSFIVEGNTVTLNGKRTKDIAQKVDTQMNDFLRGLKGKLVDVKITPMFQGASGDYAFITVLYEPGDAEVKEMEKEEKNKSKSR